MTTITYKYAVRFLDKDDGWCWLTRWNFTTKDRCKAGRWDEETAQRKADLLKTEPEVKDANIVAYSRSDIKRGTI